MIKLIGFKRLVLIVILVGCCAVLGPMSYFVLGPQNQKVDRELNQLKSDISTKRAQTISFREDMAEIKNEAASFQGLQSLGFLGEQSRVDARKRIEAIQGYSRVLSARFSIATPTVETVDTAPETDRVLLVTQISIDIDAQDDADVYKFVSLMENAFIGHVSVTSLEVNRILDVNEATLRRGATEPIVLVQAKLVLNWQTLVSRQDAVSIGALSSSTEGM